MTWLRLDDGFPEHPKVRGLSDRAFRLHVEGLCYCARNLSDGAIDKRAAAGLRAHVRATPKHLAELVAANLWHTVDSGYQVNDYTTYNPAAAEVKASRSRNAERQARYRDRNGHGEASRNGARNTVTNAAPSRPLVGDNPKEPSTTWQPAKGTRHPARDIQTAIRNGVITDHTTLEAEMRAHPALTDAERAGLRALIAA